MSAMNIDLTEVNTIDLTTLKAVAFQQTALWINFDGTETGWQHIGVSTAIDTPLECRLREYVRGWTRKPFVFTETVGGLTMTYRALHTLAWWRCDSGV